MYSTVPSMASLISWLHRSVLVDDAKLPTYLEMVTSFVSGL